MGASLCGYMNLPSPVDPTAYLGHIRNIRLGAQKSAEISTANAALEAKQQMKSSNIRVSVDGTWQRRGFSSKNGVVTVLSVMGKHRGSKVIDTEVMSTFCHTCAQLDSNENTKLATIAKQHDCAANHQGSSGKMEADGAVTIFKRSESKYGLIYSEFLGDGDSKAYKSVQEQCNPDVVKLECTGHIQKRMGTALLKVVADHKTEKFVTSREGQWLRSKNLANRARGERLYTGIGGVNRLTKDAVLSIQGHYGGAIRDNDTVEDMKSAIWNIYNHRRGDHSKCPDWCGSHKNDFVAANKRKLPSFVCELIKPVFERLSSEELLTKCLHGGTQNANEAFHHNMWARCPKEIFVGLKRIQLATATATIVFNDGESALIGAFEQMGIPAGINHYEFAMKADSTRVADANRASSTSTKSKRRKKQTSKDSLSKEFYGAGAH